MAFELVEDILDHAPADLTHTEVLLLVAVAEFARVETRMAAVDQADLARRVRVDQDSIKKICQRLEKRGIQVRLAFAFDRIGRPLYAVPGRTSTYIVPTFVPPENCSCHRCTKGVSRSLLRKKEGPRSRQGGPPSPHGGTTVPPSPLAVRNPKALTGFGGLIATAARSPSGAPLAPSNEVENDQEPETRSTSHIDQDDLRAQARAAIIAAQQKHRHNHTRAKEPS